MWLDVRLEFSATLGFPAARQMTCDTGEHRAARRAIQLPPFQEWSDHKASLLLPNRTFPRSAILPLPQV